MLVYVASVDWAGGEFVWAVPAEVLKDVQRRILGTVWGDILSADCPREVFLMPVFHSRDLQFRVPLQHLLCEVQDLLVVGLSDEILVVKLFVLQTAIMMDKLDSLGLEVDVALVASHICDQHRVVLLWSLYRWIGWTTGRAVSVLLPRCPSTTFISNGDSPSEHHWR